MRAFQELMEHNEHNLSKINPACPGKKFEMGRTLSRSINLVSNWMDRRVRINCKNRRKL